MVRKRTSAESREDTGRSRALPTVLGVTLAAVAGLIWYLQGKANDLELDRELRALPGGDAFLTEWEAWADEGKRGEGRAIWVGAVDEIVRTNPEEGRSVLLALKLVGVKRIAGSAERQASKLYVTAREFDFAGIGFDEPLTGQRWLVATFENEHGQRYLQAAIPAPAANPPKGEIAN